MVKSGPGSSVGIATYYGLDGPEIESHWAARFSAPVQTGPGAQPASCTMGTGSFPGVKSDRDVTLTPHHILVPRSRKSRAIPLLSLWAVRPVQSLSACRRVHITCSLKWPKLEITTHLCVVRRVRKSTAVLLLRLHSVTECITTSLPSMLLIRS